MGLSHGGCKPPMVDSQLLNIIYCSPSGFVNSTEDVSSGYRSAPLTFLLHADRVIRSENGFPDSLECFWSDNAENRDIEVFLPVSRGYPSALLCTASFLETFIKIVAFQRAIVTLVAMHFGHF